jgi:hypothetical protein
LVVSVFVKNAVVAGVRVLAHGWGALVITLFESGLVQVAVAAFVQRCS